MRKLAYNSWSFRYPPSCMNKDISRTLRHSVDLLLKSSPKICIHFFLLHFVPFFLSFNFFLSSFLLNTKQIKHSPIESWKLVATLAHKVATYSPAVCLSQVQPLMSHAKLTARGQSTNQIAAMSKLGGQKLSGSGYVFVALRFTRASLTSSGISSTV